MIPGPCGAASTPGFLSSHAIGAGAHAVEALRTRLRAGMPEGRVALSGRFDSAWLKLRKRPTCSDGCGRKWSESVCK